MVFLVIHPQQDNQIYNDINGATESVILYLIVWYLIQY